MKYETKSSKTWFTLENIWNGMNYSYPENATGITKCSNAWSAWHDAGMQWALHVAHSSSHSLTHSFKKSTLKEKLHNANGKHNLLWTYL